MALSKRDLWCRDEEQRLRAALTAKARHENVARLYEGIVVQIKICRIAVDDRLSSESLHECPSRLCWPVSPNARFDPIAPAVLTNSELKMLVALLPSSSGIFLQTLVLSFRNQPTRLSKILEGSNCLCKTLESDAQARAKFALEFKKRKITRVAVIFSRGMVQLWRVKPHSRRRR